jgi:hypothetical protein
MRLAVVIALGAGCGRLDFEPVSTDAVPIGTDGAPDVVSAGLVDRGLLVRYFLDEAASGQGATQLVDSAPDPAPLALRYVGAEPRFFESDPGKGLQFDTIELDGGACAPLPAKILDALSTGTTGTIEVVANIMAGSQQGSRLMHIGADSEWAFSIGYDTVNQRIDAGIVRTGALEGDLHYLYDLPATATSVLYFVVDLEHPEPLDRVQVFVDDARVALEQSTSNVPLDGDRLELRPDMFLCIGNREIGGRSPQGTISYGAMYSVALTAEERAANRARLEAWNDR